MTEDEHTAAAAALRAGNWGEAVGRYRQVVARTDDARAYDDLAQAAWWLDDAETSLTSRESAYRAYRADDDDRSAARAAASLGYDSMLFGRGVAVGRGWLARAADLLAGQPETAEVGWLAARRGEVSLAVQRDPRAGLVHARSAEAVGARCGDSDLVFVGRALAGLAMVRLGAVDDGMGLLDACATAATAGDVADPMWMGKICCWLISACQQAGDLSSASSWCVRVEEVCARHDLAPLLSVCRTQYAGVLLARGDCAAAESTLVEVLDGLRGSQRTARLDAVTQLGELRRLQGRFAEAGDLFRQAGSQPPAVVGLARLRIVDGQAERASTMLEELLRALPDGEHLERVGVLAAAVEAGVASGRDGPARRACVQLGAIAERLGTDAVLADWAAARALLAEGEAAEDLWQRAVRHSVAAGRIVDEAGHRLALADHLERSGRLPAAREQAELALDRLRALGSGTLVARAHTLLGLGPGPDAPLTRRQRDVLRLLAHGGSNATIAAELHLSEHTVHRHVANIYTALGVGSRAEAATYAATHELI